MLAAAERDLVCSAAMNQAGTHISKVKEMPCLDHSLATFASAKENCWESILGFEVSMEKKPNCFLHLSVKRP